MSLAYGSEHGTAPSLAVIGGGMTGIAAAESASRQGFRVELFEWSGVLGGRAASMFEPTSGQWIDNGQHLVLGCCTEFLALNERLELAGFFERKDSVPFVQIDGKRWTMAASSFLPNRWQLAPAFLKIPFLSFRDRVSTGLLLRKLAAGKISRTPVGDSFVQWLRDERVSPVAVEKFWAPVVFSALSETVDHVSFEAVRKVVRDGFMAGKEAMALHIPTLPLREIYHDLVSRRLRSQGVRMHFHSKVDRFHWEFSRDKEDAQGPPRIVSLELKDGSCRVFDRYILAVPAFRTWEILSASDLESYAEQLDLGRFEPGAITTIHLWFNHRLLPPEHMHTALLGGPGQFLVCPKKEVSPAVGGVYHTVVISASHRLLSDGELTAKGSRPLLERVVEQLRRTFSQAFRSDTVLLHSRVTTCVDAVFSPNPTVYAERPSQETPFTNFALGGDWTHTDWPSTLEGAVRSGLKAVESVVR